MKKTIFTSLVVSLPFIVMSAGSHQAMASPPPQKWKLDASKTKVNFSVSYLRNSTLKGRFNEIEGSINFDENNPQNTKVNFVVQTESIDTELKARDYFIRRKELLNTKQYPTLRFVSSKVNLTSPREGTLSGNFIALGQSKPLTVKVKLTDAYNNVTKQPVLKFTATGQVNRHDYGVTAFPRVFGTNVPIVITGELIPDR
ncbi:YceI family protein [Psychrobacter lutiphocae]|uniref:YceI family protein n=1 Tax=Psychrobacter lutiphocae TaxID=540500 RepID=UPI000476BED2|nr:YceI family protein [Psychrobacter lutiphocae]